MTQGQTAVCGFPRNALPRAAAMFLCLAGFLMASATAGQDGSMLGKKYLQPLATMMQQEEESDFDVTCDPWLHDTPAARCEYVMIQPACASTGILDIQRLYFCTLGPWLGTVLIVAWLALLFSALVTTAECFFCPSIERISEWLRLSPSVAGATLLALGNGATDVFTQIAATKDIHQGDHGGPDVVTLALSEPLGSGMFIINILLAVIVLVASSQSLLVIRGAHFMNNIYFYLGAVAMVFTYTQYGQDMPWLALALLLVYYLCFIVSTVYIARGEGVVHMDPKMHEVAPLIRAFPSGYYPDALSDADLSDLSFITCSGGASDEESLASPLLSPRGHAKHHLRHSDCGFGSGSAPRNVQDRLKGLRIGSSSCNLKHLLSNSSSGKELSCDSFFSLRSLSGSRASPKLASHADCRVTTAGPPGGVGSRGWVDATVRVFYGVFGGNAREEHGRHSSSTSEAAAAVVRAGPPLDLECGRSNSSSRTDIRVHVDILQCIGGGEAFVVQAGGRDVADVYGKGTAAGGRQYHQAAAVEAAATTGVAEDGRRCGASASSVASLTADAEDEQGADGRLSPSCLVDGSGGCRDIDSAADLCLDFERRSDGGAAAACSGQQDAFWQAAQPSCATAGGTAAVTRVHDNAAALPKFARPSVTFSECCVSGCEVSPVGSGGCREHDVGGVGLNDDDGFDVDDRGLVDHHGGGGGHGERAGGRSVLVWLQLPLLVILSTVLPRVGRVSASYPKHYAVVLPLLSPLVLAMHYGVPLLDPEDPSRMSHPAMRIEAGGAAASLLLLLLYPRDGKLGGVMLGAFTVLSFVMSLLWLDVAASQLISVAMAVGQIVRMPPALLGATLLAWGNCVPDMVANISMALDGYPTMAIMACFASPLFTLLSGWCCVLVFTIRDGAYRLPKDGALSVLLGCALVNMALWALVVPLVFNFVLTKRAAVLAVVSYATLQTVYLLTAFKEE